MPSEPSIEDADSRNTRNRSLKLATTTSLVSKLGTILLRFISIPIASRVLGIELFGVYTTIILFFQFIDILYIGIGSTVTRDLSKAAGDRFKEKQIFATGFLVNSLLTIAFGSLFAIVLTCVPITTLFGEKFAPYQSSAHNAAWLALIIIVIEIHCAIGSRARDGYMETWISNIWGTIGNFLAAGCLIATMKWSPSIEMLILSVNGMLVLSRLGNFIHLLLRRSWLLPTFGAFARSRVKNLFVEGFFFNITYAVSALVEFNLITWLFSRYFGPGVSGNYAVLIALHISALGILQMLTIPAWPAIISAKEKGDYLWIRSTAIKLQVVALAIGIGTVIFYSTFGTLLIKTLIGTDLLLSKSALVAFGIYSLFAYWRKVNQTLLLGLEKIRFTAMTILIESVLTASVAAIVMATFSSPDRSLQFLSLCLALVSAWVFPLVFRKLVRLESSPAEKSE